MRIVTDIGKCVTVAAKRIILNERSIKKLVESRLFRVNMTTLERIEHLTTLERIEHLTTLERIEHLVINAAVRSSLDKIVCFTF